MRAVLNWCCLIAGLGLAMAGARAGEVIGNTYIGERFGHVELTSIGGKWNIIDKEKDAQTDVAGVVAEFRLKEPVGSVSTVTAFEVMGFRKSEGRTVDFVINWRRDAFAKLGAETEPTTGRIAGKKIWLIEKRHTNRMSLGGKDIVLEMKGSDIILEGEKAIFLLGFFAHAPAYPEARQLLEELAATAKY